MADPWNTPLVPARARRPCYRITVTTAPPYEGFTAEPARRCCFRGGSVVTIRGMSDVSGQKRTEGKPIALEYATPQKREPSFYDSEALLLAAAHFALYLSLFIAELRFGDVKTINNPPGWLRASYIVLSFPSCLLWRNFHVDNFIWLGANSLLCGLFLAIVIQSVRQFRKRRKGRHD
jgi:hypothetical protein